MDNLEVELLVIGWGKAGKTLAKTLGAEGGRVALVEQSDQMYGGSCINIACVPTKALVHEADGRRADDDSVRFFADAQAFRNDLTAKLRAANFRMLDALDEVVVLNGKARVIAPALRRNAATRPLAVLAIPCSRTGHDDFTPKPWEPAINLAACLGQISWWPEHESAF